MNRLRLNRLLSILFSNWRLKLQIVFICILLLTIIYQHNQLKEALNVREASNIEMKRAADDITKVSEELKKQLQYSRVTKSSNDMVNQQKQILRLDNAAMVLGVSTPDSESKHIGDVCSEKYMGPSDWPFQYNSWIVEDCPGRAKSVSKLLTVIFTADTYEQLDRVTQSLWDSYGRVEVIVQTNSGIQLTRENVRAVTTDMDMSSMISMVNTKYVMLGGDLDYINNWTNIERGIRLLSSGWMDVVAVGGAVRNSTGHWRLECRQLELAYYRLELRPGYDHQYSDCMVCSYVGGPVLMATRSLADILDKDVPWSMAIMDLALQKLGMMLACPDMMFFTMKSVAQDAFESSRSDWNSLATKHQFQGVQTSFHHSLDHTFSCDQVNMACDIRSQSSAFLVPWCCISSFRYILTHLETISQKLGIEYALDSGSTMGAVKLGNFIPWDIDMDIDFKTEYFHMFKSGGEAHEYLTKAGIELYNFKDDMYGVKDAGMFFMFYGGIIVEMLGSIKPLSRKLLPTHLQNLTTRIEVGPDLWIPVTSHPGLYTRGRYGPGYLYHVQSWRFKSGMTGAYSSYSPGAWQPCSQPGHHACLNNYPIQGNTEVLWHSYPGDENSL